ncbi:hypothetical protein ACP4OV_023050 [Aristida adscensionis]
MEYNSNSNPMKGYYFTLKDGLFHVSPDGVGGPFKLLADATDAVRCHRVMEQEECQEKSRSFKEFLDNLDVAEHVTRVKELLHMLKSDKRDTEPSKPAGIRWVDEVVASLSPGGCDTVISEAADRMDRLLAEKQAIRNGMKWMQTEVLEAFEFYKASSGYQGPKYEFVRLDEQCLIYDDYSKSYHHYNFTMKKKTSFYLRKRREKWTSSNCWTYQLFFAEIKSTEEGKKIVCCPLQPGENGMCHGCQNTGINLIHPCNDEYEKGSEDSGFPFDSDSGCDD